MGGARLLNFKSSAASTADLVGGALRDGALKARETGGEVVKDVRTTVGTRYNSLSENAQLIAQIIVVNAIMFGVFFMLLR
jgi:hypothetical protein